MYRIFVHSFEPKQPNFTQVLKVNWNWISGDFEIHPVMLFWKSRTQMILGLESGLEQDQVWLGTLSDLHSLFVKPWKERKIADA